MRFQIEDIRREEFFKHRRVGRGRMRPYGKAKVLFCAVLSSGKDTHVHVRRSTREEALQGAKDLLNIADKVWARMLKQYAVLEYRNDEQQRRALLALKQRRLKKEIQVGERAKKELGRLEKA